MVSNNKALVFTSIVVLVLAPFIVLQTAHASYGVAPDFSMTGWPDKTTFNLYSYKGNVILLEFFYTWCPHCQNESSELVAVKSHFGNSITMISVENAAADWSDNNFMWFNMTYGPVTWRLAEDTGGGFGLYSGRSGNGADPQVFIIDQGGNIAFMNMYNDTNHDPIATASLLEGQINSLMPATWKLTVSSAQDSPSPAVGDNFYSAGSSVNCSITSPVTIGSTVWVCTGRTGTGDVPSGSNTLGQSTWVAFTITQNSTITWNWAHYTNIDNTTAWNMMTNGSFPDLAFLDVRDASEGLLNGAYGFDAGHIYGSIWMSWNANATQANVTQLAGRQNEDIIVYCKSGGRSTSAAAYLVAQGFTKVYNLKGPTTYQSAMPSWINEGYPYVNASAHMFVRGLDNSIYYRALNGTDWGWQNWNVLPGSTVDSPAAAMLSGNVTNGNDTMHVVVRGSDGSSLWYGYLSMNVNATDNTFHGWTLLDGATPSAPTLASNSTALCLVVRGEDNRIYYRCYVSGSWSSWFVVPTGATLDSPAAAMLGNNLHIVVRGMDNSSLWDIIVACDGTVVRGWMPLSGATSLRPVLASSQDLNELYVVVTGLDNRIYYMNYTGSGDSWGSWSVLPTGYTAAGPAATVAGNELYTVVQGMDGSTLWLGYTDEGTNTFSGWSSPSGATQSPPTLTG